MTSVEAVISVLLVILGILSVETRNLKYSAYLLGIGGVLGGILLLAFLHVVEGIAVLLVFGFVIPAMLIIALKKLPNTETEPVSGATSLMVLALIAFSLFAAAGTLISGLTWYHQLAITMFIVGLYALLVKGNLVKFAVGLVLIDEGLHICSAFSMAESMPFIVVVQSALCSLITIMVVGMILYLAILTYQKTGTLNSWSLRRLVG